MRTLLPSERQTATISRRPHDVFSEPSSRSNPVNTLGPRLREFYALEDTTHLPVRLTELAEQLVRRERARDG